MAEQSPSYESNEDEAGTTELFPCEECFNEGVDKDAEGFCIDCRMHLCKRCVIEHKRRLNKSHIIMDEFGRAMMYGIVKDETRERSEVTQTTEYTEARCRRREPVLNTINDDNNECEKEKELFKTKTTRDLERARLPKVITGVNQDRAGLQKTTLTMTLQDTLSVHNELCVSSVTMLTDKLVVFVDNHRYTASVLNTSLHPLTLNSLINFRKKPACIARVSQNKVVVTFPLAHEVTFVKFVKTRLHMGDTVNVHGECFGIEVLDNKMMVIAYPILRKLKILTKKGKVVKSISTDSLNLDLVPSKFVLYQGNAFLFDPFENCVRKCLIEGKSPQVIHTTYLPKIEDESVDMTVSSNGDLFVSVTPISIFRVSCETMEIENRYLRHELRISSSPVGICSRFGKLIVLGHKRLLTSLQLSIFNA